MNWEWMMINPPPYTETEPNMGTKYTFDFIFSTSQAISVTLFKNSNQIPAFTANKPNFQIPQ